ncbi:MAG: PhoX family phosphatase [Azospirillaceae bacterium]
MDTNQPRSISRSRAYEASEDIGRNPSTAPTLGDVVNRRFGRRDMMRGALAVSAITAIAGPAAFTPKAAKAQAGSFAFDEIEATVTESHEVAPGYDANVLIRWGDPVVKGAPSFDPMNQTVDAQEMQFGYNNDYVGYAPLPAGSDSSDHGLLVVNHEYTNEELMFPGFTEAENMTEEQVNVTIAAHGVSVVEIEKGEAGWSVVADSDYGRRLSGLSGKFTASGPAAGHDRLKTSTDPTGMDIVGTLNNCAGGTTPWGTIVTAEENFHGYFGGEVPAGHAEARNHERYGTPGGWYVWNKFHDRFDVSKEPNEPNRFGWIVEIDPYDPAATPVKRTALGRFKHEGAESVVNGDGRVVFYMGDDERFEYLYKFVTAGTYTPDDRAANAGLLDDGTLYVAKFNEDGTLDWMPLIHGQGPLTAENDFHSQADVVIETRRAADLLGATPMDRPEDVEPNPTNGRVYVMLTNNSRRTADQVDAANPRPEAPGHIVEIVTPDGDHAAERSDWSILVLCGDPNDPAVGAEWHPDVSANGWFDDPDNCAIDGQGRLWVSTDGNNYAATGRTDGLWSMETEGDLRGLSKLFFRCPVGAEMCGPKFTPDDTSLFLAVQHPADAGVEDWPEFGRASTFEDPATRWPDFEDGTPPRPSVVVITKQGGGPIGV